MWAIRRATYSLKNRGFSIRTSLARCTKSEIESYYLDDKTSNGDSRSVIPDGCMSLKRYCSAACDLPKSFIGRCSFSSQVDAKNTVQEEDDFEDGFSELETPANADVVQDNSADEENEDELISEPDDGVEESQNELELSDTDERSPQKRSSSALFNAITAAPGFSFHSSLAKWVEEGNELKRSEISFTKLILRKRKMYGMALLLSEWLESTKRLAFVERDYASHLDLIAKVRGLQNAENYIEKIPKSFKGEVIYRTLLANCVAANKLKKAEEVFNKMKALEFPITSFTCNQLLLLYKRLDPKKIADVLLLMDKENVKPTVFTYHVLIDTKGLSNDMTGMNQIVDSMKAEGIEPNIGIQSILAKHYISGGLREKAEAVLKDMEGGNIKENRRACRELLPLYGALGKADDVRRVWKVCESNPKLDECVRAIVAWGRLNNIEEAEAVFDRILKTWKRPSSEYYYSALLKVYVNHKMLAKGKDLVKRMTNSGCQIGPLTWDLLIKLYVGAGEVEKADSILQKATQQKQMKPLFSSYMVIMHHYVKRGDVHNSEKMLHRMRQGGYPVRLNQFQALLQAYINAKTPAYGIRERMKAYDIFPNKGMVWQLAQVDAFKKTAMSDLLD